MNFFRTRRVERRARAEAALKVDGNERLKTAEHGTNPLTLAKSSFRYQEAVQTIASPGAIREYEEELRKLQNLEPAIGRPFKYSAALTFLTAIEFWGALQLLHTMGVPEGASRFFGAIGLAAAFIGLTKSIISSALTTARATPTPDLAAPDGATKQPLIIPWKAILLTVLYVALVVSIALVRLLGVGDEDTPGLFSFSDAIISVASTAGPAWLAAHVAHKLAPAVELAARIARVERRLRKAKAEHARARKYLVTLDEKSAAHTNANAETDALYSLEHERTEAALREGHVEPEDVLDDN